MKNSNSMQSRRDSLRGIPRREMLAALSASTLLSGSGEAAPSATGGPLKISIFSKHFQWTNCREMAAIARDIGFDGVDLTVRAGGHVLPERVEADLPPAVEAVHRAGLTVTMISTEITSVQTPHVEAMLRTASQLGIRQYRWGGLT